MDFINRMAFVWHARPTVTNAHRQQVARYVVINIISHPQINVPHAVLKTARLATLINLATPASQAILVQPVLNYANKTAMYAKAAYAMCAITVSI
jgi:hypothetical protein